MSSLPPPPPDDALTALLPPDVDLAVGWRHEAAVPVWHGVVWGRLGRGDLAWEHLDRVQLPLLAPWIAAERGRILRELGLHGEAEARELPALLRAEDEVDAAMLRVSLVADAVGVGDTSRAVRRLGAARSAVEALTDGPRAARQRLRLGWVDTEVAFLTGQQPPLSDTPRWDEVTDEPTVPPDLAWGSVFHRAKALLFAGIARGDGRLLEAAAVQAPPVLAWAVHLARADSGVADALTAARAAWSAVVAPPEHAAAVAATPTAVRLTGRSTAS
ncbi:hypothetical protein [Nitriliruptor alkaliphilus]|uniref:hypothetical protein n=1 Tax=Nitriliruptor alkaliphilus TaxID=427918 RepID=UPI000695C6E9|nr:hypothetical protein [Nitriliruptor alkaliphilus]